MTRHIYDRSNATDIACHFIETADGAPLTACYIPAVDYVRPDWDNGTLARITRKPPAWLGWVDAAGPGIAAALGTVAGIAAALLGWL